jgi:arylsulfatase A-like enzyme
VSHKRIAFLGCFACGSTALLTIALACLIGASTATAANARPNIVFIMADDLGYGDLGCYGQKDIQTPSIDRLAQDGIRFMQAYAGSTVCAPSRSSLMTGMHNGHNRVRDNIPHYEEYLQEEDVTLADILNDAGYRCGGIGKWSLGGAGSKGRATNQGFDMFFGYLDQDHAHYYYPRYLDDDDRRFEMPGNPMTKEHYSHDLLTERALRFIQESKDQPFFFYAAYTIPHISHESESPTKFAVPSDDPYSNRDWDQKAKNYAAMITRLDGDVGRIVALIDELGLAENTLIVFTSDNGAYGGAPKRFYSSGPLRGYKRALYEGGIRVPFIARWRGRIPAGQVSEEIIAFWDMMPTFAELAGSSVPDCIDGRSALDALLGRKRESPHDYLYWDYGHCRAKFAQAVRWKNWKSVRVGRENAIELYDLSTDPGETTDIAGFHPDVVEQIESIMTTAAVPSERYPVGQIYRGRSKWVKDNTQN